mmetsp:Transcript_67076/g.207404  ORF Transcript_67076/g.207404 Transcript_67076/m.207404 type:complete len:310 (-) Transcript_67076:123-1052(-)
MHNAGGTRVHVPEGLGNADHDLVPCKAAGAVHQAVVEDEVAERHAHDELEHQRDSVLLRHEDCPVGRHNAWMPQAPQDPDFVAHVGERRGVLQLRLRGLHGDVHAAEDAPHHIPEAAGTQFVNGGDCHLLVLDPPALLLADRRDPGQLGRDVSILMEERVEDRARRRGRGQGPLRRMDVGLAVLRVSSTSLVLGLLQPVFGLAPQAPLPQHLAECLALIGLGKPLVQGCSSRDEDQAGEVQELAEEWLRAAARQHYEVEEDSAKREGQHDEPADRQAQMRHGDHAADHQQRGRVAVVAHGQLPLEVALR